MLGRIVLALLAVDGIISAVVGALLLPTFIGPIPFPVSALAAGAVNTALVWAAMYWTDSMRIAALPLWTWLAAVVVMIFGGPGGDIIFAGPGLMAYGSLIFIAAGALPPVAMLRRRHRR
ncbi:hypothetical protein MFORT_05989 [Mycolicibacterium fortuitum subsp. fortuitum DSM 46621 = ATCC 6841 = JCM 6387]|uniref:Uncharacterized protein n=1 Tax=Mycolicibacterium fortuitum subsp. fortuitum DSM 46621 = ATCC 6841 = JCM 6387 TaxID=1214102 RepID=K0V7F2_MYCFO|nr:hypothetical protein G155_22265 [Mycobacterium sp. VKM Ac-1817D]EJZ15152.1 hypothetical protein MFORT_05989 [Mycolicibacterium fortuitum subsp. fortuitum DSM 46621 = ATCC 6841 = JCM 6387]BDE00397.1 hypothetical protein MFTT_44900 [Mycolicibacterium fortuitum subsp. fortuitum]CRL58769.1 hypothetical protein CPGR_06114 [Mycolicibacterium fortuitum subsp. fortuitum DSM 46621 = ATCC 6841 = JCM 6387]CRL74822.1 hypothetical protein CPGR_01359 [Mycolicibacter nonchromogenicus]